MSVIARTFGFISALFMCIGSIRGDEPPTQEKPPKANPIVAPIRNGGAWSIEFDARDMHEYVKQLFACGAILSFCDQQGKWAVIRDFTNRPVNLLLNEDLRTLNFSRIGFRNEDEPNVQMLAQELGLNFHPKSARCYFPPEFEARLIRKLFAAAAVQGVRDERQFKTAVFRVTIKDGKPEVAVVQLEFVNQE